MRSLLKPSMFVAVWTVLVVNAYPQNPPYDVFPDAQPPYFRVRYEGSLSKEELVFPANFTLWVPPNVQKLRGIVVHQHGCGEGSCRSGLTGAYDLHWQALAQKHDCALLAPAYEQPQEANCQLWCDPRNGSASTFDRALVDLAKLSKHPELPRLPLALWGHSGGGHWCGGMLLTQPERIAAAWLRSGVPLLAPNEDRPDIKAHLLPPAALKVPVMCNLGTKEGVTVTDGRFARVWPANEEFFLAMRQQQGLVGIAIDPLTAHECGNSRYLAIPWLDKCLHLRLPGEAGAPLKNIDIANAWYAEPMSKVAEAAAQFSGDRTTAAWLPDKEFAQAWMEFCRDTKVTDLTPPPAPAEVKVVDGNLIRWRAAADLQSGIEKFLIMRDGNLLFEVIGDKNRFGRPLFQNLLYSDTPTQPLAKMEYHDTTQIAGVEHQYAVITVNTVGLESAATAAIRKTAQE